MHCHSLCHVAFPAVEFLGLLFGCLLAAAVVRVLIGGAE